MRPGVNDRVQLWYADPLWYSSPDRASACLALLDDAELERLRQFRFERDRMTYLVAHALLRRALSVHVSVDPRRWRFRAAARGKPFVNEPTGHRDLSFSISHAPGCVAVAVTARCPVGVDVEHVGQADALEEILDRYLSPSEIVALLGASAESRRDRLLAHWTLKEAYVKGLGTGLGVHLPALTFHLDESPRIRLTCGPGVTCSPEGWWFLRASPTTEHALALAVQRGAGAEVEVHIREARDLP